MTTIANESVVGTVNLKKVKQSEFFVSPAVLVRALKIAELCAGKDDTLPILNTVAITATAKGNVIAQSTDRYRLVRARIELAKDEPVDVENITAKPALIELSEVKTLLTWLKPKVKALGSWGNLHIRLVWEFDEMSASKLEIISPDGSNYSTRLLDGEYPKIGSLLPDSAPIDEHANYASLNPSYLEAFAKIGKIGCERNTPMEIIMGKTPAKPIVFRGRDEDGIVFDGLQMPVRLTGGDITEYETL